MEDEILKHLYDIREAASAIRSFVKGDVGAETTCEIGGRWPLRSPAIHQARSGARRAPWGGSLLRVGREGDRARAQCAAMASRCFRANPFEVGR